MNYLVAASIVISSILGTLTSVSLREITPTYENILTKCTSLVEIPEFINGSVFNECRNTSINVSEFGINTFMPTLCRMHYNGLLNLCNKSANKTKEAVTQALKKLDYKNVCTNFPEIEELTNKTVTKDMCSVVCRDFNISLSICSEAKEFVQFKVELPPVKQNVSKAIDPPLQSKVAISNLDQHKPLILYNSNNSTILNVPAINPQSNPSSMQFSSTAPADPIKVLKEKKVEEPVVVTNGDVNKIKKKSHEDDGTTNKVEKPPDNIVSTIVQPVTGPAEMNVDSMAIEPANPNANHPVKEPSEDAKQLVEDQPETDDEDSDPMDNKLTTKSQYSIAGLSNDDLDGDSNFFPYFMVICLMVVLGYVAYHNRQKLFALMIEGKRNKRQYRGRRPNSANYHKLDSNLEEAITSDCSKSTSHIIY